MIFQTLTILRGGGVKALVATKKSFFAASLRNHMVITRDENICGAGNRRGQGDSGQAEQGAGNLKSVEYHNVSL